MNVGAYTGSNQTDRLPLLDAKLFGRLQKKGRVTGKILAVREIKSPKFKGLAMDLKTGTAKFSFLTRFDRWDIGNICAQVKSEETDDWLGQMISFVTKKGTSGTFVNVERPAKK
jgi:hypothetical protein